MRLGEPRSSASGQSIKSLSKRSPQEGACSGSAKSPTPQSLGLRVQRRGNFQPPVLVADTPVPSAAIRPTSVLRIVHCGAPGTGNPYGVRSGQSLSKSPCVKNTPAIKIASKPTIARKPTTIHIAVCMILVPPRPRFVSWCPRCLVEPA